jgi:DNA primase
LVEGEACADCLVKLGLIATTWPNGALALGKADLSPLGNRKVICWPDNDEPGLRAMLEAQARLQTMGALALLLDVHAMGLPPKGDAVDWLDKFIQRRSAVELCAVPGGFEAALEEVQCLPVWLRKAAA